MTSSAIRQSFLDFFKEKQHTIVPSSSLLPDSPNLLFTNAGMNQFVPIFLGQTPCPYKPARAADTQKCIRAGGKHNDLEDVGFDTYHHTFFEMLGNWSFGDYFKKEAIEWSWELVVKRWNFPASRLYATIYSPGPGDPAGLDREAHEHWSEIFIAAGLDPAYHVVHGNKKDNFWMMGDTGPCGPCSELHVNLLPGPRDPDIRAQIEGRNLVNSGDARCIEIWNLVFIQFNANPDGSFVDLPAKHVDTGMGFERVTSMIQGTKGMTDFSKVGEISNYNTDVFRPLFDELEKLTGKTYKSTLPKSAQSLTDDEKADVALRVIADHVRTLSFSIADGIRPGNTGRDYVLRRILRRAVSYGRNLGLREPFLGKLVPVLGNTMGHIFPDVVAKAELIRKTLTNEEDSFMRTLEQGRLEFLKGICPPGSGIVGGEVNIRGNKLRSILSGGGTIVRGNLMRPDDHTVPSDSELENISGRLAFDLYDTYGFPLDLTQLMAREHGLTVDVAGFEHLMEEQKARGKAAQKKEVITVEGTTDDKLQPTTFYGFDELQSVGLVVANEGGALAVTETPFYAEMGGQVGDAGEVQIGDKKVAITNTVKSPSGKVFFHKLAEPVEAKAGDRVTLHVNEPRRAKIEAHHSGTHVLNWALRKVLGNTIGQKGSYVGPDRLRFDFSHGAALTLAELAEVEKLVNDKIEADVPATWEECPYAEVKGDPNILQAFGDKYGETVRVVSIGDFSKELCGGTHVRHSSKIGHFKILSEGAIAAGIRRIEAVSGEALAVFVKDHLPKQDEQFAALRQRKADLAPLPVFSGAETPVALWQHYSAREKLLHEANTAVAQHEKEAAKQQEATFQKEAVGEAQELISESAKIGEIPFIVHVVDNQPAAYLPILADAVKKHWQGVLVLVSIDEGKVGLLAAVAPAYTKKIQAGKIIQAMAPLVGGKGGGRPELAQGGGTNPDGVAAALEKAEELIRGC